MAQFKMHTMVIGGGVIGLSIAYELSKRNHRVTLLEKNLVGRAASWAGAGILPPTNHDTAIHPIEKLEAISHRMHPQWSAELEKQTGINTGLVKCGGIYIARTPGEIAALIGQQLDWQERQIEFEELTLSQVNKFVSGHFKQRPNGDTTDQRFVFLPDEMQLRNPHFVRALATACRQNGVTIVEQVNPIELIVESGQTQRVRAGEKFLAADQYCVAAGPWSEPLLAPFGVPLPSTPVRGQMVLFKLKEQIFESILNEGTRYLVPRDDGHVLGGATIEEVGFNVDTVPEDIESLVTWACSLMPDCNSNSLIKSWAGLRPGTYDGFPYLGPVADSKNTWVATGHFKSGLHQSPGTALLMADLIEGQVPAIDLAPFAPSRAAHSAKPYDAGRILT